MSCDCCISPHLAGGALRAFHARRPRIRCNNVLCLVLHAQLLPHTRPAVLLGSKTHTPRHVGRCHEGRSGVLQQKAAGDGRRRRSIEKGSNRSRRCSCCPIFLGRRRGRLRGQWRKRRLARPTRLPCAAALATRVVSVSQSGR